MTDLTGKVAVIAGCGSIGGATAKRLAANGANVVLGDLDAGSAQQIADEIVAKGGTALGQGVDITDEASIANLVRAAVDTFGRLDIFHANAADMGSLRNDTDALSVSLEVFDRTIEVNLRGHLLCTRHALPEMLSVGGGALIYTSSAAAFNGEAERVAYAMSKSGLHALVRHVATRWGKDNIRANAVAPGFVMTERVSVNMPEAEKVKALANTRSQRLGRPEDIASMVALLASDEGAWINGQVISVDGGNTIR